MGTISLDDGSSDESTGVAKRCAEEYPGRVPISSIPNIEIGAFVSHAILV